MSYTKDVIAKMLTKATADIKTTDKLIRRLRRMKPQMLDNLMLELHQKEFSKINCLECANCCKTISPAIQSSDIGRLAVKTKMKTSKFIDRYLLIDEEGDYVFKQAPCPFLGEDKCCTIYECRPRSCREYPHTNRKRFYQILDIIVKNSKVCPAVFSIIDHLKQNPAV